MRVAPFTVTLRPLPLASAAPFVKGKYTTSPAESEDGVGVGVPDSDSDGEGAISNSHTKVMRLVGKLSFTRPDFTPHTSSQWPSTLLHSQSFGSSVPHTPQPSPPPPLPQLRLLEFVPSTQAQPLPRCVAFANWEQPTQNTAPG